MPISRKNLINFVEIREPDYGNIWHSEQFLLSTLSEESLDLDSCIDSYKATFIHNQSTLTPTYYVRVKLTRTKNINNRLGASKVNICLQHVKFRKLYTPSLLVQFKFHYRVYTYQQHVRCCKINH